MFCSADARRTDLTVNSAEQCRVSTVRVHKCKIDAVFTPGQSAAQTAGQDRFQNSMIFGIDGFR